MKTTKEMIKVMQAYDRGEQIQLSKKDGNRICTKGRRKKCANGKNIRTNMWCSSASQIVRTTKTINDYENDKRND